MLKLIHPSQNPEAVRREILAVNSIQSPRVPRIFDSGQLSSPVGNLIWVREQRIQGESLRTVIGRGPLSPRETLTLGVQLLEALAAAETRTIVHRDVKPENVMAATAGNYWLLDFGIARHLQLTSVTPTLAPFGKFTPGYAPPEQFRNLKSEIDCRADLFATAVTLHEAATGSNPFIAGARDAMEVLKRVEQIPLQPLVLNIARANDFRDLISAMAQKRRDHRPRTVADALAWIRDILTAQ